MRISPTRRRDRMAEPLLPMIDVVFFLIIFFMMVSRLAEPEPVALDRPVSGLPEEATGELSLYIDPAGEFLALDGADVLRGAAAVAEVTGRCVGHCGTLLIHADAAAPARAVAALLAELATRGLADVRLVTVAQ